MAEKVAKELGLEKRTVVECKDLEVIEGDLNSDLWIMNVNNELRIAVKAPKYIKTMELLKSTLKENFELRLEKAILSEFPIDYEDVKVVVLKELKNSDKSIEEVVKKVEKKVEKKKVDRKKETVAEKKRT